MVFMKIMCDPETEEAEHPSHSKLFSLASALKFSFKDRKPASRAPLTLDDLLELPKFQRNKGKRQQKKKEPISMVISGKDQQSALKIKHMNMEKKGKKQLKTQIERKQKSLKKKETTEGKQMERKMAKKSVGKEMYESMRVADQEDDVMEMEVGVGKNVELCRGCGRRGFQVEL